MCFAKIAETAAKATKWLIAAKIMVIVGTGIITIDQGIKEIKKERRSTT